MFNAPPSPSKIGCCALRLKRTPPRPPQEIYFESRGKCCKKLLRYNGYPNKVGIFYWFWIILFLVSHVIYEIWMCVYSWGECRLMLYVCWKMFCFQLLFIFEYFFQFGVVQVMTFSDFLIASFSPLARCCHSKNQKTAISAKHPCLLTAVLNQAQLARLQTVSKPWSM